MDLYPCITPVTDDPLCSHTFQVNKEGFRHNLLIVWAEETNAASLNAAVDYSEEEKLWCWVKQRQGMSLKVGVRERAKMVKRDLRFPV